MFIAMSRVIPLLVPRDNCSTVFCSNILWNREFAEQIHEDNIIETMRLAKTKASDSMKNHVDTKNDCKEPDYMGVFGLVTYHELNGSLKVLSVFAIPGHLCMVHWKGGVYTVQQSGTSQITFMDCLSRGKQSHVMFFLLGLM